jgi:AraC family transcriptional regulator
LAIKGLYAVDENSYLILNDEQPYSITIESARPVESFCIFFKAGFAEQVYYSLGSEQDKLLDNPEPPDKLRVGFFDRTYPHDNLLSPALRSLKSSFAERKDQLAAETEKFNLWLACFKDSENNNLCLMSEVSPK